MIQSINTLYDGNYFRSRLEARWAYFFNLLSIEYQYEQEGFTNNTEKYLPDFYLPNTYLRSNKKGVYIEIKNANYDYSEFKHGNWFDKGLVLFAGTPDLHIWGTFKKGGEQLHPKFWDNNMMFWVCEDCGVSKIDYAESNYDTCPECKSKCNERLLIRSANDSILKRFEHGQ